MPCAPPPFPSKNLKTETLKPRKTKKETKKVKKRVHRLRSTPNTNAFARQHPYTRFYRLHWVFYGNSWKHPSLTDCVGAYRLPAYVQHHSTLPFAMSASLTADMTFQSLDTVKDVVLHHPSSHGESYRKHKHTAAMLYR